MISIVPLFAAGGIEQAILGPFGFFVAVFVGMVGFFSPCVLPLLPGYLSYVSGLSGEDLQGAPARRRVLLGSSLFVLGFSTVFTLLGIGASLIGDFLGRNLSGLSRIAGVIVIVMGLAFVLPGLFPFLERERRPFLARAKPGLAGAFPLGLAFAVGWTPCIGPGLGVMLALGAEQGTAWRGGLLLFAFSLGFGVWFILAALLMRRGLAASKWMQRHARALQMTGGVMMLVIGVLLVTDQWNALLTPVRRLVNTFTPPV